MRKILLFTLSLMAFGVQGQEVVNGTDIVMSDSHQSGGHYQYEATSSILLNPGFDYRAGLGGEMELRINRYGMVTPDDGLLSVGGTTAGFAGGVVGSLPGTLDVSSTGAACYSVPIQMPDGIGGLKPQIAVTYNNQSGNGLLGWGWNLSGLSSVTRVGAGNYFDGLNSAVSLDDNYYAIDGKRLLFCYNANGNAYYKTEMDEMQRIVAKNVSGQAPASFEVWHDDGTIWEYGATEHSRIEAQNSSKILSWMLNRIYDRNGNEILFDYYENNAAGECYIDNILYSGNTQSNVPFAFKVIFQYDDNREDDSFKYVSNSVVRMRRLLKGVVISNLSTGNELYKYMFTYASPANNQFGLYHRLTNIAFKAGDMALRDTKIIWNKKSSHYPDSYLCYDLDKNVFNKMPFIGDFNGDGYSDVALVPYKYQDEYNEDVCVEVYFNDRNGGFEPTARTSIPASRSLNWVYVLDFNGDNLHDLLLMNVSDDETEFVFYKNKGNGDFVKINEYSYGKQMVVLIGDFLGKGREDALALECSDGFVSPRYYEYSGESVVCNKYSISGSFSDGDFVPADFDGDGRTELLLAASQKSYLYKVNFNSVQSKYCFNVIREDDRLIKGCHMFPGDFNGDGMADMLYYGVYDWWNIMFGTGNGFSEKYPASNNNLLSYVMLSPTDMYSYSLQNYSTPTVTLRVSDFDGDGVSDIAVIKNTGGNYYYTMGFKPYITDASKINFRFVTRYYFPGETAHQFVHIGNFLGKENTSFLCTVKKNPAPSTHAKIVSLNPHSACYSVERIVDGLGNAIGLRYAYLMPSKNTTSSFYSFVGKDFGNGIVSRTMPVRALRADTSFNVNGKPVVRQYEYENILYHPMNKGFIGFESKTIRTFVNNVLKDKQVATSEVETMGENLMALPKESKAYVGENQQIANVKYTYRKYVCDKNDKVVYPVLVKQVKTEYDLDVVGKFLKNEISEKECVTDNGQDTKYNEYVSLTKSLFGLTSKNSSDIASCDFVKTEEFDYDDHPNNWIINRVKTKKMYQTLGDASPIGHCENYSYNDAGQKPFQITSLTTNPNLSNDKSDPLSMTISYSYDKVGNLTSQVVSANNGKNSRSLSSVFGEEYGYRCQTQTQDLMGRISQCEFDKDYGFLTSKTDFNGFKTLCSQDPFGITTKQILPDGLVGTRAMRWAKNSEYAPANATYYCWTKNTGAYETMTFFHKTGLELRTITLDVFGTPVFIDKTYDDNGNVITESLPYRSDEQCYLKRNTYDSYNRPVSVVDANGTTTEYKYDGLSTTTISTSSDGSVQKQTRFFDVVGNIVQSTDNSGLTVFFKYNSDGKVASSLISGKKSSEITVQYDHNGNRTMFSEPNYGKMTFVYDAFGQLLEQTTPNGVHTEFEYDNEGKMTRKVEKNTQNGESHETQWIYEDAKNGNSLLKKIIYDDFHSVEYAYNDLLYQTAVKEIIDGEEYVTSYLYDEAGRISEKTFPSGLKIHQTYTNAGYLRGVYDDEDNLLWETDETNSWGYVTEAKLGNGLNLSMSYCSQTGYVNNIKAYNDDDVIQNLVYSYDGFNNLLSRKKLTGKNVVEDFVYDDLHRLVEIRRDGHVTCSMSYDPTGNILEKVVDGKSVFFDADYSGSKPNAIKSASVDEPAIFPNLKMEYNTIDKLSRLSLGKDCVSIEYGADGERRMMTSSIQGKKTIKVYVGDCEFVTDSDGKTTSYTYLQGPDGVFAVHVIEPSGKTHMNYVLKDNLGSWNIITDEKGNVVQELSFDAWGNIRNGDTWSGSFDGEVLYDYGFTGHEHLYDFGVVNMNGRIYDPQMSMMLSPDNNMQMPECSQNFNRYSYCLNNPLRYKDPSGEWIEELITGLVGGVTNLIVQYEMGYVDDFIDGCAAFGAGFVNGAFRGCFSESSWIVKVVGSAVTRSLVSNMNDFVADYKGDMSDIGDDLFGNFMFDLGSNFVNYAFSTPFKIEKIYFDQSINEFFSEMPVMHHVVRTTSAHIVGNLCAGRSPFDNFGPNSLGLDFTILIPLAKDIFSYYSVQGVWKIENLLKKMIELDASGTIRAMIDDVYFDLDFDLAQVEFNVNAENEVNINALSFITEPMQKAANAVNNFLNNVRRSCESFNYSLMQLGRK